MKISKIISTEKLTHGTGLTLGNIGARVAVNKGMAKMTIDPKLKNGIVFLAGLFAMGTKSKFIQSIGAGAASQAGASILTSFVPGIGEMTEPDLGSLDSIFEEQSSVFGTETQSDQGGGVFDSMDAEF